MVVLKLLQVRLPALLATLLLAAAMSPSFCQTITWKLADRGFAGKYAPVVLGTPLPVKNQRHTALHFNGTDEGWVISRNPVEGWSRFTIEVLFMPDGDGPVAPRFIHFQDKDENRGTFEVRITPKKTWYLDAFLKNGKAADKGLALSDSSIQHPADRWYWVAMTYDGKHMTSYVNGVKELEGDTNFPVAVAGEISLGVRLNKVNWFKGSISELRFHPVVLKARDLQKISRR